MGYSGEEGRIIDPRMAAEWTENYRDHHPEALQAMYFGGDLIRKLLDQPGAVGIRIFMAEDGEGATQMVVAGTDEYGNDITSMVGALGMACPGECGKPNLLNGRRDAIPLI